MDFIETPNFTRRIIDLLNDDDYSALQMALLRDPSRGAVIKGSGGIRKVRWALPGRGKSGGIRVIYYCATAEGIIYMLSVYAKNEADTLTAKQIKGMRRFIERARQ